jgi:hypothetical protein
VELRDRPEGRPGPPGLRGPLGPLSGPPERNIQALFGWFDNDGDNMLSRREFAELSQFVERRRPGRRAGPADPDRVGGRGLLGSPTPDSDEFRRRMERVERLREGRRLDDRPERRPNRERPPRPPRPDGPPGPPAPERNRPDAI